MEVYRIVQKQYMRDLSGIGAGLFGGRWNPVGINMLYTAEHVSLAYLEYLVHNYHVLASSAVCLLKIEINTSAIFTITSGMLPGDWDEKSYTPRSTQILGAEIIQQDDYYAIRAPSAITPGECNILLNPNHPDHSETKIVEVIDPFVLDARLMK